MVEKNKGFQVFAHILMIFLTLCCLAPFILLFMSSFTSEDALIANGYSFFPAEFSAEAYRYILTDSTSILSAYGLSFLVTIVGTICNLTLTTLYAYPSPEKSFPAARCSRSSCSSPCCSQAVWCHRISCGPGRSTFPIPSLPC